MGVQDESFKGGERAQRALELRRLALVLQIVAPHLVELAAHGAGVAEDLIAHVHLPVSWKQRDQVSQLSGSPGCASYKPRGEDSTEKKKRKKQQYRNRATVKALADI